jgi:hypothetical protein
MFPVLVVTVRLLFLDPPDVVVTVVFPIFTRFVYLVPLAVVRMVKWEFDFGTLNFLILGNLNVFIFFSFGSFIFII